MQSDPIGLAGGLNTYGYVGGNPLLYSDPLGLLFAPSSDRWSNENATTHPYGGPICGTGWTEHVVPDNIGPFNFSKSCQKHDDCFGTKGADFGECNNQMYKDMKNECSRGNNSSTGYCDLSCKLYKSIVSSPIGEGAYNDAQNNTTRLPGL